MLTLAQTQWGANLQRWPATLHPDHAERCYYGQREVSRRWVGTGSDPGDLRTRGGMLRWSRILACGDPQAALRLDGAVGWQHRWCGDRACYACARSRSRRMATSLRAAVERRGTEPTLVFLTLTQPKVRGATARQTWDAFQRRWERLRHTRAWPNLVVGGVRTMDVTWSEGHAHASARHSGWHVHAHLVVELRAGGERDPCPACEGSARSKRRGLTLKCHTCNSATYHGDGTMPAELRALILAWCEVAGASPQAQCGVPLDRVNVGQLAKYLTNLWDLDTGHARELFAAAASRRIIEGFGTWRSWQRWGAVESTPRGWFPSHVPLRVIECMDRNDRVEFVTPCPGAKLEPWYRTTGDAKRGQGKHAPWRPVVPVASLTAGAVLDALRRDPRPVWERETATPPDVVTRCRDLAVSVRAIARERHLGHQLDPPLSRTWEF